MSELNAIRSGEIYDIIEYEDCSRTNDLYYPKSEADKVIAEKDEEIRKLNHKYWSDKADEAAKMKRLVYGGEIIYLDEYCNEKDWRIMHKVWEDEESKCRAKAEEYK